MIFSNLYPAFLGHAIETLCWSDDARFAFSFLFQRSSSSLYRRLRYRNCLNYITLHYNDYI